MAQGESSRTIKAALYIDFDNVYSSLRQSNEKAAERFAQEPLSWLEWFENGSHETSLEEISEALERRILVRRCYLNPSVYSRFRAYFTRNGFAVIDCPALTTQGK